MKYLRRGSGYYIDVGAADLVADGDVKLAKGQVDHLTEDAVVLADGTELPADLVVYATGYGSMNGWVADLISPEAADKVGKVWGLGSDTPKDPGPWEGEERNMWKPTRLPALWFHGGNLHQSRHYSLYLALQLKARYEGIPTPVYEPSPGPPHPLEERAEVPGEQVGNLQRGEVPAAVVLAPAPHVQEPLGVLPRRRAAGRPGNCDTAAGTSPGRAARRSPAPRTGRRTSRSCWSPSRA